MSEHAYQHSGACDCEAVRFVYYCATAAAELEPRACQCDFCRPGGLSYLSEPGARLLVQVRDMRYLYAQTFATGTAEFMYCAVCNHPLYVRSAIEGRQYALVVSQALKESSLAAPALAVDYQGESLSQRLQRRTEHWIAELEELADGQ